MTLNNLYKKIQNTLSTLNRSKYMSIVVGVLCMLVTILVFYITRPSEIKGLEEELDSTLEIYVNRVESRIDTIEFNTSELASDGYPVTPLQESQWDTKTAFYIHNLIGVKSILLVNPSLQVQRTSPTDHEDYDLGTRIDLEQVQPNTDNIVLPLYNNNSLTGFVITEINLLTMMLEIDEEWSNDYQIEVFTKGELSGGSCTEYESNAKLSVCGDVNFQDNIFHLVIQPTSSKVRASTFSSRLILVLGLSLSALITYIWYTRSVTSDRLEHLVDLKTEELRYMSFHDQLTGLYNRRYYEQKIKEHSSSNTNPFSIILADINGLKLVNDAFGHQEGDKLIKLATNLMLEHSPKDGIVCRIGGDEFVILLPNINHEEAEQIMINIEKHSLEIRKENIQLSISFGVATRTDDSDLVELFRLAEDRMYQSKLIEVPSMRSNAIDTIMQTLYEKDNYSEQHVRNVAELSQRLAQFMNLPRSDIKEIHTAALLHDIGKIIIPSKILNKEGKLDDSEYAIMKSHPEIGFRILNSSSEFRSISKVVLHHHERYDGYGYPQQLHGEDIPIKSRLISIVDAFDAMTTFRTYQPMRSKTQALEELKRCSGTQFDPHIVSVFEDNLDEITRDM